MDMPNTDPATLAQKCLEEKYKLASKRSVANYSFFMGINGRNLEDALKTNPENVCGISDDGLYFHEQDGILANIPEFLDRLFARSPILVALHSENDGIIKENHAKFREEYGDALLWTVIP
jgi:dihydroorotase